MAPDPAHILVVDDDAAVCGMVRGELTARGLRCLAATDPLQAKQLLDAHRFDVLIADIAMPRVSGLDLLAHARHAAPACKVILITGLSSRQWLARALMLGAYDYLEKPFDLRRLGDAVVRAARDDPPPQLPARAAAALSGAGDARRAALDSLRALNRPVEARDPCARGHSEQVACYAMHLAKALGLDRDTVESLRAACLLHDIGKIAVPQHVLAKPGPLTDEERECLQRHPQLGAEILAATALFAREAELVRHHHERWDGRGYPDGLAGEDIPLPARVIHIADSIDGMLTPRFHRDAAGPDETIARLQRNAGTQFDPQLAAAAARWCRDHNHVLTASPELPTLPAA